ncbi:MAG: hypothetical protein HKO56_09445 [Bacteroidia bacterium]|nr:hypothetical protein [Bacteroidia bacterium]NNC86482.1 hypothetical protein [Bacteroidia bacterium]NNM16871.1 hypothetical protein [Bacteroidia bacterium]
MRNEFKVITVLIAAFVFTSMSANAQVESDFGTDSVKCTENISLYQEYYKQDNYVDALPYWKKVVVICPKYSKNVYLHGEKMYKKFIAEEKDEAKKSGMVDTLLLSYQYRIAHFNQEGLVKGKMGLAMYDNRPDEIDKIDKLLSKSVELEGDKSSPNVLFRYVQVKTKLFHRDKEIEQEGKVDKVDVLEAYDKAATIATKKIDSGDKYAKNYQIALDNIETIVDPFLKCDDIREIYFSKVESNPDDVALLKKLVSLLTKRKCLNKDFYLDVAKRLHVKEPTAESGANLARMYVQRGDYLIAMDYYNDALNLQTDNVEKGKYYLEMAEVEFHQFKNYSKARAHARKAASARPDWGKPYILIGDLYMASSKMCGDGVEAKAVFWAAVDKYRKAKAVDPSIADFANKKAANLRKYYPTTEQLFFISKKAGDSYKVECWIGETTTVRTSD